MYHPRVSLGSNVDESLAGYNLDFSLVQISVSSFMYVRALTRMTMASWSVAPKRDNKYVGLYMTLIECIEISAGLS